PTHTHTNSIDSTSRLLSINSSNSANDYIPPNTNKAQTSNATPVKSQPKDIPTTSTDTFQHTSPTTTVISFMTDTNASNTNSANSSMNNSMIHSPTTITITSPT